MGLGSDTAGVTQGAWDEFGQQGGSAHFFYWNPLLSQSKARVGLQGSCVGGVVPRDFSW